MSTSSDRSSLVGNFDFKDVSNWTSTKELRAEVLRLQTEINRLQDLHSFSAQFSNIKEYLKTLNTKFESRFAPILTELKELRTNNESLEKALINLRENVSTLELGTFLAEVNPKIDKLATQISTIENGFTKITYADKAKSNSNIAAASVVRQVFIDEQNKTNREKSVILKGLPNSSNVEEIVKSIADDAKLSEGYSFFLLKKTPESPPTAVRIKTASKEEAIRVMKSTAKLRSNNKDRYPRLSARPDYTKLEMDTFIDLWKNAIEKNNIAGKMEWTVQNLKLVRLRNPRDWTPKEQVNLT